MPTYLYRTLQASGIRPEMIFLFAIGQGGGVSRNVALATQPCANCANAWRRLIFEWDNDHRDFDHWWRDRGESLLGPLRTRCRFSSNADAESLEYAEPCSNLSSTILCWESARRDPNPFAGRGVSGSASRRHSFDLWKYSSPNPPQPEMNNHQVSTPVRPERWLGSASDMCRRPSCWFWAGHHTFILGKLGRTGYGVWAVLGQIVISG